MFIKLASFIMIITLSACAGSSKYAASPKNVNYFDEQRAREVVDDYLSLNNFDWGMPVSVASTPTEFRFLYQVRRNIGYIGSFLEDKTLVLNKQTGEIESFMQADVVPIH